MSTPLTGAPPSIDGSPVLFDLAYGAETPQTVIDQMRAMVESAVFCALD